MQPIRLIHSIMMQMAINLTRISPMRSQLTRQHRRTTKDEDGTECQSDRILWLCQRLFGNDGCLKEQRTFRCRSEEVADTAWNDGIPACGFPMDANGNVYTKSDTDSLGNTFTAIRMRMAIPLISARMVTYEDGSNVYTKNDDGTYTDGDGHVWTSDRWERCRWNATYSYTADDGTVNTATIKRTPITMR